ALQSALVVDGGQTVVLEGLRVCPSERGQGVAGVIQRVTDSYIKQVYPSVTTKRLTRSGNQGPEKLPKFTLLACRGYFQKTLSVNTIHRAIRRCRLKLYRSKKEPYLNMIQKHRRFLWAKAHLKWTVAKWKTVLWSDETKFEVLFGKLGRHVIRTKEDKDNPSCYQRSVQKPASLMVWGCMSACGMGSLHIWKGTINAE
ncbi:hypothetical protein QTP70_026357, partial [Hemibagrus guttatus]